MALVRDRPAPGPRRGGSARDRQQAVRRLEQPAASLCRVRARERGVLQVRLAHRSVESRLHRRRRDGRIHRRRAARESPPRRHHRRRGCVARDARHQGLLRARPAGAVQLARVADAQGLRHDRRRRLPDRCRDCVRGRLHVGPRHHRAGQPATPLAYRRGLVLRRRGGGELPPAALARSPMTATPTFAPATSQYREPLLGAYLVMGVLFGIVLTKGELVSWYRIEEALRFKGPYLYLDRKSTRLNSSHLVISYAVFCLKKKKTSSCCLT